jgi:hypothetical protein
MPQVRYQPRPSTNLTRVEALWGRRSYVGTAGVRNKVSAILKDIRRK